jgi:uncharacterized membrane protein
MADEIEQAEWANPDNWGDGPMGLYFSKRDRRLWVPKRQPGIGWTLNLAHRAAGLWIVGFGILAAAIVALPLLIVLVVVSRR